MLVVVRADAEVIGGGSLWSNERRWSLTTAWIRSLQGLVIHHIGNIMMVLLMSAKLLLIPDSFHLLKLLLIQGSTDVVVWCLRRLLLDLHIPVVLRGLVRPWSLLILVNTTTRSFITLHSKSRLLLLLLMRLLTLIHATLLVD